MKVLVTGGGGFLGRRIVELLLGRSDIDEVRFASRGRYPDIEALGARGISADIRQRGEVETAVAGVDVVIHVAALASFVGASATFWETNVKGTRNIIAAAQAHGVKQLVYTSTPSVVGYEADLENAGPQTPYATTFDSLYPETKAAAERVVLAANSEQLATVALRPHLIFGPGDRQLMPSVVKRAQRGRVRWVGDGSNRVDLTYIDNAAWAHLDALDALQRQPKSCAGKAYFISNGEPVVILQWVNDVLRQLGIPTVDKTISLRTARTLGTVLAALWKILPLPGEPMMTPFLANALARSHWYDMGPAQRDLNYWVRVPLQEATTRTVAWLQTSVLCNSNRDVPQRAD